MTPQTFIESRLARLSREPKLIIDKDDLIAHVEKTVLSKKFRKYAVDDEFVPHLRNAVSLNFERHEPIKFVFPFGGYKLWRFDEAPEADWAELFTMLYYAWWLKPIADTYEPGIWFDFSSDDVIVERMNHIPKSDTEAYKRSFDGVITFLEQYLPSNLTFTMTPVGSRYTPDEFDADLTARMEELLAQNSGQPPEVEEKERAMMDLNVRLTDLERNDPEWHRKNKLMHDAYMAVAKRRPYNKMPEKITVFTKAFPKTVGVGSTKTSIAKFWAGVGVLQRREDEYIETILTPEQLKNAPFDWVPVRFRGLKGKNFDKIRIL